MNGTNPVKNHTPLVVICVTFLATIASTTGAFLLWKGFAGGGELVVTLNTAISGLIGFLGGRATASPPLTPPDITISGQPPKVEVTQPQTEKKENP